MKTEDNSQSVELRILEAAEKEFFEKGFDRARTTSIASTAGVTHAMLHYYFRTKENLFEKVLLEKQNAIKKILLSAIENNGLPLLERMRGAVGKHFDLVSKDPNLARFIINEIYTNKERMQIFISAIKSVVFDAIDNLQREIDSEASKGNCKQVNAFSLLLDIISLNIFPFAAAPMLDDIFCEYIDTADMRKKRREDNIETILNKLRP